MSLVFEIMAYIGAFGLMDLFMEHYKISKPKKIITYIIFLMIGLYYNQSYW